VKVRVDLKMPRAVAGQYVWHGADCAARGAEGGGDSERRDSLGRDVYVVFVRDKNFMQPDSPKIFPCAECRPGVKNGATTEIIAGLLPAR